MGANPKTFKQGGGRLNGDFTILDLVFMDKATATEEIFDGQSGKSKFNSLHAVLSLLPDGAEPDQVVRHPLFAGNADDFEIDGAQLMPDEALLGQSDFTLFIRTLVEGGFPEDALSEENNDFSPVIGARVKLKEEINTEKPKQINKKTKKEYDRRDLIVVTYYGQADAKPGKGKASKAAPAGKSGKGKAPAVDVGEEAAGALKRYLEDAPKQTLTVGSKIRMKVLTDASFKSDPKLKEAVTEWLADEDNLGGIDGVSYDAKKQTVTLD